MSAGVYLMAIDIGTGGAKAAIFDAQGSPVSLRQQEYRYVHPQPGWSELDPEEVWRKVAQVSRECLAQSGLEPAQVKALGLSVLGETGLAVDERGSPTYPAIESIDRRANAYQDSIRWFEGRFGAQRIFELTSYPLNSMPPVHKILWLKAERPAVFARTAKYVSFQEFVLWRLTGRPLVDYSIASRTMLFDASRKAWIGEFLEAMGLDESFVSPACLGSQPAGPLLPEAAQLMGLAPGTLVAVGAHDQSCAALGVGVVREGVASDGTGSFEAIATVSRAPFTAPELLARGTGSQCHVTPDTYLPLAFHNAAGSLVRWYRDQLGAWEMEQAQRQGVDAYELITAAARRSPPGANGLLVLPHWNGAGTGRIPPLDPASRGAIFGLTLAHTRDDLSRAVFEGITFETRYLLESFESAGIRIRSLAVTGGGAKSPFWLQLKADVTGKVIRVPRVTEASLLGAAILAGVAAGVYSGVEEAVERVCRVEREYHPDPASAKVYDRLFPLYRDVYAAALETSKRLAGFAAGG